MNSYASLAARVLSSDVYAFVATVDETGAPWCAPVLAAAGPEGALFWSSHPGSCHSRNIARSGRAFIVLHPPAGPDSGRALYIRAEVSCLEGGEGLSLALELLFVRGGSAFDDPARFQGGGPQRIYQALPLELWINDAERDPGGAFIRDFRVPVSLAELRAALAGEVAG